MWGRLTAYGMEMLSFSAISVDTEMEFDHFRIVKNLNFI
jgi:hypothetical protein